MSPRDFYSSRINAVAVSSLAGRGRPKNVADHSPPDRFNFDLRTLYVEKIAMRSPSNRGAAVTCRAATWNLRATNQRAEGSARAVRNGSGKGMKTSFNWFTSSDGCDSALVVCLRAFQKERRARGHVFLIGVGTGLVGQCALLESRAVSGVCGRNRSWRDFNGRVASGFTRANFIHENYSVADLHRPCRYIFGLRLAR